MNSKERAQITQLRDRPELLANIIESATDAIIALDDAQRVVLFNYAAERIFGTPAKEVIGTSIDRFIPQHLRSEYAEGLRRFADSGAIGRTQDGLGTLWGLRATGEEFPLEVSISKVESDGENFFAVIVRDVTEGYRAEQALRESELRFRLVADTAPVLMWMSGVDKLCTYFNKPWLEFTGRALEEELGNGWTDGVHPADLPKCAQTYTKSFDRREQFKMEYRLRRHDGEYRWILDIGVPRFNQDGSFTGYIGTCVDITERKLREQTLRETEERLRLAQRVAGIGTFEWNIRTDVNTWTPELEAMYGLPPGSFGGTRAAFENLVYVDDRPRLRELIDSTFATGLTTKGEWRVVLPDGSVHWIAGRWQLLRDESGEPSRVVGVNIDINERKLGEQQLRDTQERLRLALQAGKIYTYEWDVASDRIIRSNGTAGVLGSMGEVSLTRQQLLSQVHPDDRTLFNSSVAERTPERPNVQICYRLLRPDGSIAWFEKTARAFFDGQGRMVRMIGVVADITDRKRSEEARFRHAVVVQSSEDAIMSVALDRIITSWNGGAERIYGYTEAEVLGKPIDIIVPPELSDEENKILDTLRAGGSIEHFETVRVTKAGKRIDVSLRIFPIRNAIGETVGCSGIARDITERKRNEMELRTSEERLRLATLAGKMYAYEWDMQTDTLVRSPEYVNVLGPTQPVSSSRSQIMEKIHPEDRSKFVAAIADLTPENPIGEVTYRVLLPGRAQMWLKNSGHAFFDRYGKMLRMIGMVADVTEQKLAEQALLDVSRKLIQAQEQERSRIGRELHDDVTQRLALLAVTLQQPCENLIEVQSRIEELSKEVIGIVDDVQALSHDLHSSKLEYLGVVSGMKSWCRDFAERYAIHIEFTSDVPSGIPLETGLCLFRVLQEALHNAVKHSHAKRAEVRLSERSNHVNLTVSDSGKGFDVDAALKGKGLGLTSMRERVRLVNGTITIESKRMAGTKISVHVPLPQPQSERIAV